MATVILASCSASDGDNTPDQRDLGANVTAIGGELPDGMSAEITGEELPLPVTGESGVSALGPVVEVGPDGPLSATATLRFTLDQPVAQDDFVFVATRRDAESDWQYLKATVSPDGQYASVETDHLSSWWPFEIDFAGLFETAQREILDALTGDLTAQAEHPRCDNEDAARQDGYTISHESRYDTLFWCFGIENGERTLKVANRMRYPLEVDHPGFETVSAGAIQLEFQQLARLISGDADVLFPHDTAVYTVELGEGDSARLSTEYSGLAQSLHRFDIAFQALVTIMSKLGSSELKNAHKYWEAMDKVLKSSGCLNAVADGNIGRAITNCFNPDTLLDIFGFKGLLLSPFIAVGSVANWLVSEFSSIHNMITGHDRYRATVSREEAPVCPSPDQFEAAVAAWINTGGHPYYRPDAQFRVAPDIVCEDGWAYGGTAFYDPEGVPGGDHYTDYAHTILKLDGDQWSAFHLGGTGRDYYDFCGELPQQIRDNLCF